MRRQRIRITQDECTRDWLVIACGRGLLAVCPSLASALAFRHNWELGLTLAPMR